MKRVFSAQLVTFVSILMVCGLPGVVRANVTGTCDNCHTMHNSQDGVQSEDGPYETLLTDDCVGCHSNTTADTIKTLGSSTIPVVYNTTLPGTPLAGGNFYWVENVSDAKGHNVFPDNGDEALSEGAPGSTVTTCGVSGSCHDNLNEPYVDGTDPFYGDLDGTYGCESCHFAPAHHADDTGTNGLIDSADQGWYRFLSGHDVGVGVSGIEDDDWQYSKNESDHNEYLGDDSYDKTEPGNMRRLGNTMTGFCVGCHGNFHVEQQDNSWIRHPSDAVIPNEREYADAFGAAGGGTGIYNPDVPVARESLVAVSAEVNIGSDMVMCLSCHVPHGSPYDDLLRWDYEAMQAGGGSNTDGCFACHTTKDGV